MLVNYSSSSDDEEEKEKQSLQKQPDSENEAGNSSLKRKSTDQKPETVKKAARLPSVPSDILNMFGDDSAKHEDDPNQHGGRLRSFKHERGNWATHVYLPFTKPPDFDNFIEELLGCLDKKWQLVDDFHISLSRTFPIRYHWIDGLYQSLNTGLGEKNFPITFHGYKIYTNDEKTRSFLGVNVATGCPSLLRLVEQVNKCLDEYKLPGYYDKPDFHLSLIWCLGAEKLSESETSKVEEYLTKTMDNIAFMAHQVLLKTGNKMFNLALVSS